MVGRVLGRVPAPGLVCGGIVGLQGGAALSVHLYPAVGPAGVVMLRLVIAAVLLGALWRPRWRRPSPGTPGIVLTAGTLLAVHHLAYYEAVGRIPLGAATTIEFVGPFAIALATSRRPADLVWSLLAAAGVLLLGEGGIPLDLLGIGLAALAAACWAGYILVSARLARRTGGGGGLALAVAWGALLSLPYGITRGGGELLEPRVLLLAAAVAVLAGVLPYSCNLEALRRVPPRVFGILTSLEPAVGAVAGLLLLGQRLAPVQYLGISAVAAASIGASLLAGDGDDGRGGAEPAEGAQAAPAYRNARPGREPRSRRRPTSGRRIPGPAAPRRYALRARLGWTRDGSPGIFGWSGG
ncbi:EamA family transporter [Streptomyces angustmyceticus]|nr:EamA family transporter [Streptomyces angustmyceticus]UAL71198.1 EamA family transporter [Streptomyces angustmyceticus]